MRKDYLEKLKLLKIMDDDFARLVFEDEAAGLAVLKILNVVHEYNEIIHYETQKDINNPSHRSLIFDIFVITNEGGIDVEIENKRDRATPKRARLHASEMDVHMSNPSEVFDQLPTNIVVFICSFDYFKKGLPYYTIQRSVKELGIEFEDESKIIYINGQYEGNDEIGRLIHDLKCTNPNDMYNEVLRNRVRYFKEHEGGQQTMCKIWDDIRKEGKLEGKAEGVKEGKKEEKLNSLKQIMINLNMSIEEAMNALGIPENEREIYNKLISE